jgi:hypothetical protein
MRHVRVRPPSRPRHGCTLVSTRGADARVRPLRASSVALLRACCMLLPAGTCVDAPLRYFAAAAGVCRSPRPSEGQARQAAGEAACGTCCQGLSVGFETRLAATTPLLPRCCCVSPQPLRWDDAGAAAARRAGERTSACHHLDSCRRCRDSSLRLSSACMPLSGAEERRSSSSRPVKTAGLLARLGAARAIVPLRSYIPRLSCKLKLLRASRKERQIGLSSTACIHSETSRWLEDKSDDGGRCAALYASPRRVSRFFARSPPPWSGWPHVGCNG